MYVNFPIIGTIEIPLVETLLAFTVLMIIYITIAIYEILKLREELKELKSFREDILVRMPDLKEKTSTTSRIEPIPTLKITPAPTEKKDESADEISKIKDKLAEVRKRFSAKREEEPKPEDNYVP